MPRAARAVVARALAALIAILAATAPARADEGERRFTLGATGAVFELDAFSTRADIEAVGATLGLSLGLRNTLELGLDARYLSRRSARLPDARLDGIGGDGYVLYTDVHAAQLGGHLRWSIETGPLIRLRPLLGLRAGVALRTLRAPELVSPDGGFAVPARPQTELRAVAGAEAGVSYRVADRVQVALVGQATVGERAAALTIELSWLTY